MQRLQTSEWSILVVLVVSLLACSVDNVKSTCQHKTGKVVINEVFYDASGGNIAFLELKGEPGLDIHCLSLIARHGDETCATYETIPLRDLHIRDDGYLVIAAEILAQATVVDAKIDFQNGPDAVELVDECCNETLDALAYGSVNCSPGIEVGEQTAAPKTTAGKGLSRIPDGQDTQNNESDFEVCPPTPGEPNRCGSVIATDAIPTGAVIISEILINPPFSPEWFELYNASTKSWNLNGCIVGDGGSTGHTALIDQDLSIEPGGYALLADSAFDAICALQPKFEYGTLEFVSTSLETAFLACPPGADPLAAAESVVYKDQTYRYIDQISYQYDDADMSPGKSWSLCPGSFSSTDNDDPAHWINAVNVYCTIGEESEWGTPGMANPTCPEILPPVYPSAGELLISEILFAPASGTKEWVEIFNSTDHALTLQGCRIQEGPIDTGTVQNDFTFPKSSEIRIESHQYYVLMKDLCLDSLQGSCDVYESLSLSNTTGEFVELSCPATDAEGQLAGEALVDRAEFNQNDQPSASTGISWQKSAFCLESSCSQWCQSDPNAAPFDSLNHGTPAASNRICPEPPHWPEPGEIQITEVMAAPLAEQPEWIELHNRTAGRLDLQGCTLHRLSGETVDTYLFDAAVPVSILADQYYLLAKSSCEAFLDIVPTEPSSCSSYSSILLPNTTDNVTVQLLCPSNLATVPVSSSIQETQLISEMTYNIEGLSCITGFSFSLDAAGTTCLAADNEVYDVSGNHGTPATPNPICPLIEPVVHPQIGDLAFSEIMPAPVLDAPEWLELRSLAVRDVQLNGCRLERSSGDVVQDTVWADFPRTTIAANQIVVLSKGTCEPFEAVGAACTDYGSITLPNTSDNVVIRLYCPVDESLIQPEPGQPVEVVVAEASYNQNDMLRATNGFSLSQDSLNLDYWCLASAQNPYDELGNFGTPGQQNPACPPLPQYPSSGDFVFTEIMAAPNNSQPEWLEVFNSRPWDLNLNGCQLQRQSGSTLQQFLFPVSAPLLVTGRQYLVLAAQPICPGQPEVACIHYSSITLPNTTDDVALRILCPNSEGSENVLIDEVRYNRPDGLASLNGFSFNLDSNAINATTNDDPLAWCLASSGDLYDDARNHGTPAEANSLCPEPPVRPGSGDVVITEIMAAPLGGMAEWIEVLNLEDIQFNLSGCRLERISGTVQQDYTFAATAAVELPPGEYHVLAKSSCATFDPATCDVFGTLTLPNTGENISISLFCPNELDRTDTLVDAVQYNQATGTAADSGLSLSLDPSALDAGQNDDAQFWCASLEGDVYDTANNAGTPAAANPSCPAFASPPAYPAYGEVIITEIMISPDGYSGNIGEWFEVYNRTVTAQDLQGCRFAEGGLPQGIVDQYRLPGSVHVSVPPGGFVTFARDCSLFPELLSCFPYQNLTFDDGEHGFLSLYCPNGMAGEDEVDRIEYNSPDSPCTIGGHSCALAMDQFSAAGNDVATHWCSSSVLTLADLLGNFGTPAAFNEHCR